MNLTHFECDEDRAQGQTRTNQDEDGEVEKVHEKDAQRRAKSKGDVDGQLEVGEAPYPVGIGTDINDQCERSR